MNPREVWARTQGVIEERERCVHIIKKGDWHIPGYLLEPLLAEITSGGAVTVDEHFEETYDRLRSLADPTLKPENIAYAVVPTRPNRPRPSERGKRRLIPWSRSGRL